MTGIVLQAFIDKNTLMPYYKGETYMGTDERIKELSELGCLEPVEEAKKPRKQKKPPAESGEKA